MPSRIQKKPYSLRCVEAVCCLRGGRKKLAAEIGLSNATVTYWFYQGYINPRYAVILSQLSEGKFTAEEFLGKFDEVEEEK